VSSAALIAWHWEETVKKLCIAILLFSSCAFSALAQSGDRARFVGAWKLVALERPGADGQIATTRCCGMFVFTQDGHLSVQVMSSESNAKAETAPPQQYSQGGYEASYGSYVVNENDHTFTFHVEGALVKTLIGKDLPRRYKFDGNQLIVQSTRPDEHWRAIWARY
jgi:hypothetical protein